MTVHMLLAVSLPAMHAVMSQELLSAHVQSMQTVNSWNCQPVFTVDRPMV